MSKAGGQDAGDVKHATLDVMQCAIETVIRVIIVTQNFIRRECHTGQEKHHDDR